MTDAKKKAYWNVAASASYTAVAASRFVAYRAHDNVWTSITAGFVLAAVISWLMTWRSFQAASQATNE